MREIEVKALVRDKDRLLAALSAKGIELGPELKQHDVVFGEPGDASMLDKTWLRIRTENDTKVYFTLKRSVSGQLDSIEHEVVVVDAAELEALIRELGYQPYSDLTKIRRKAKYGEVEICVDEIQNLGVFAEAEKLVSKDGSHDEIVAELWRLLNELGLEEKDEVTDGYDVLERKQRGLTN